MRVSRSRPFVSVGPRHVAYPIRSPHILWRRTAARIMSDSFYTAEQLAQLQEGYYSVNPAYERLLGEYLSLALANEAAYEFVRHGFVRRLGTLKRCIENVYSVYLPERCDKPTRNECLDLAINLQSFIFNVFGCIDNLAWVWVKEKD